MLFASRIQLEHPPLGSEYGRPTYRRHGRAGLLQRQWQSFCRRSLLGRCWYAGRLGLGALLAYASLCGLVHYLHRPAVDALFHPREDYMLEEWSDVEPTLREGDLVLMMGSSTLSWVIATAQFAFGRLRPSALRYSHVAVVVERAQMTGSPLPSLEALIMQRATPFSVTSMSLNSDTRGTRPSSVRDILIREDERDKRPTGVRRGAVILEAMDNCGVDVRDIQGSSRYCSVQRVEATRRLVSLESDGVPCYRHFAVRRLKGVTRSPEMIQEMQHFSEANEGRPLDCSVLYMLSFIHPLLYKWVRPARFTRGEVSCSELIVELYQRLGIVQRRWRWVPMASGASPTEHGSVPATCAVSTDGAPVGVAKRDEQQCCHGASVLHVHDLFYGRVEDAAMSPLAARPKPVVAPYEKIDNALAVKSVVLRDGRPSSSAEAASPGGEVNDTGANESSSHVALRAGDLAVDHDGKLYELRWCYLHDSLQTCPFHFAEGMDTSVLDYPPGVELGSEIHLALPS